MKPLTERQRRFAEEYVVDFNGTQAAIRAGYSKRGAENTAWRLLRDQRVRAEVDTQRLAAARRRQTTAQAVIDELWFLYDKAWQSGKESVARSCLDMLGKHVKLFVDRVEHINMGHRDLTEEEGRAEERRLYQSMVDIINESPEVAQEFMSIIVDSDVDLATLKREGRSAVEHLFGSGADDNEEPPAPAAPPFPEYDYENGRKVSVDTAGLGRGRERRSKS